MRLLIDANIVLDVLQKREPRYKDSSLGGANNGILLHEISIIGRQKHEMPLL